ncbi:MAG TPA: hypothetical protein VFS62_11745, partial [Chloroflexota bacterium]|nr:hypothetical protein [Chloroflexota bacterium]
MRRRLPQAGLLAATLGLMSACGGPAAPASSSSRAVARTASASASAAFHLSQVIDQPAGVNKVETTAFSPNGQRLAVGLSDGTIAVFSLADTSAPPVVAKPHAGAVTGLAWSPDGAELLSAATNGSVYLSDSTSLQVLHSFNAFPNSYPAVAWSPDGRQLAIAQGKEAVQVFDAATQAQTDNFNLPGVATRALLWLPTGDIAAGDDTGGVSFFAHGQPAAERMFRPAAPHKAVNSL